MNRTGMTGAESSSPIRPKTSRCDSLLRRQTGCWTSTDPRRPHGRSEAKDTPRSEKSARRIHWEGRTASMRWPGRPRGNRLGPPDCSWSETEYADDRVQSGSGKGRSRDRAGGRRAFREAGGAGGASTPSVSWLAGRRDDAEDLVYCPGLRRVSVAGGLGPRRLLLRGSSAENTPELP